MKAFKNYATKVAQYLLALRAAGCNFENPILWASGTHNPFYVDNRKLMSRPGIRKCLREAFSSMLKGKHIDYIYAIPKAGFAPATLMSLETNKPLLVKINDVYYAIDIEKTRRFVKEHLTILMRSADSIAGTTGIGTVIGLIAAEESVSPFMFVRQKPKDHGLMKQVEGMINPNSYVNLVSPQVYGIENYTLDASHALQKEGLKVLQAWQPHVDHLLEKVDISSKMIFGMEDLVSTGESMLTEILTLKKAGAEVQPISVFTYDLDSANDNFEKHGLTNKSILKFEDLFVEASRQKRWDVSIETKIWGWYKDQPNWGDKNGHPRVK